LPDRIVLPVREPGEEEVYGRSLLQCIIRQQTASLNMAAALQSTFLHTHTHTHTHTNISTDAHLWVQHQMDKQARNTLSLSLSLALLFCPNWSVRIGRMPVSYAL